MQSHRFRRLPPGGGRGVGLAESDNLLYEAFRLLQRLEAFAIVPHTYYLQLSPLPRGVNTGGLMLLLSFFACFLISQMPLISVNEMAAKASTNSVDSRRSVHRKDRIG